MLNFRVKYNLHKFKNKNLAKIKRIKNYGYKNRKNGESAYDPPLPTSVIKEDVYGQTIDMKTKYEEEFGMSKRWCVDGELGTGDVR